MKLSTKAICLPLIIAFVFCVFSCGKEPKEVERALNLAKENRPELEAVIDHYKDLGDQEKLEAAYFLIGNMPTKFYTPNDPKEKEFLNFMSLEAKKYLAHDNIFDIQSLTIERLKEIYAQRRKTENIRRIVKKKEELDSIYTKFNNEPRKFDIKTIKRKLLIDNIDIAFDTWKNSPWYENINFDTFCEGILPYRNYHDIPTNHRKEITEFAKPFQRATILETVKALQARIHYYFSFTHSYRNIISLKISDVFKTKAFTCRQMSSVKIALLRSLGIPAYQVFAVNGTSWVRFEDENGNIYDWESKDVFNKSEDQITVDIKRGNKRYSKVYLRTYKIEPLIFKNFVKEDIPNFFKSRNLRDVSKDHLMTASIHQKIDYRNTSKNQEIYLCTYHTNKLWHAVAVGKIKNDTAIFENVGKNKIYQINYFADGEYLPASDPFYLDEKGNKKILTPSKQTENQTLIYRKFQLTFGENLFSKGMKNMFVEGSNDKNFKTSTKIGTIMQKPTYRDSIELTPNLKFKYYRLVNNDTIKNVKNFKNTGIHLAELEFFDEQNNIVKGIPYSTTQKYTKLASNLFDQDIRTNFDIDSTFCWIAIDTQKPMKLSKMAYLFRNSFNTIEIGSEYELFYWKKDTWISLGQQKASKEYLMYNNVPKNALLVLRNLNGGKQENIFFLEDGKPVWN